MIQQTSINCFIEEKQKFNTREEKVYDFLRMFPDGLTDNEIMFKMGYNIPNMVRPRRNSLYHKGLVVCCGKRRCTITNKKVKIWRVKNNGK